VNRTLSIGGRLAAASAILCMLDTGEVLRAAGLSTAPFCSGEVLRYRVRYGPIRLSTVTISQEEIVFGAGRKAVVRMRGESTPDLPFFKMNWRNRSVLVPSYPSLRDFEFVSMCEDNVRLQYGYDLGRREVVIKKECAGSMVEERRLPMEGPVYDAGGVYMMIRCLSGSGRSASFASTVGEDVRPTRIDFTRCVEEVQVPGFDGPVRTVRFDGVADWVLPSAAGMTGEFHGWLTADSAAVLVKASIRIFLGSVVMELESFERP
jgi:hypothetical protein